MTKDQRKMAIELSRCGYIAAYRSAHPEKLGMPHISYENGWWCFRDSKLDAKPSLRVRTIDFELMTKRLLSMREAAQ